MIDIHSHLLPGIDDGPKTLEKSILAITKMLSSDISDFFATPHYIRSTYPNRSDVVQRAIDLVKTEIDEKFSDRQIVKGAEVYLEENIHEDIKNFNLNLGGSRYVLVESNRLEFPSNTNDLLYDILKSGYTPILAHPERYHDVSANPSVIEDFMFRDTLMQVNLTSLTGQYGKSAMETAWTLLDRGHVHFLASDNHGQFLTDQIKKILALVEKEYDSYTVELLTEINPEKVINNDEIDVFYLESKERSRENLYDKISSFFKSLRR